MAPLFSKVDLNKLWQFGKDLFNISKVIGRKKWPSFFWLTVYISQATKLRCVVCLVNALLQIFHRMCRRKNYENRSIFGKVMDKSLRLTFWATVY